MFKIVHKQHISENIKKFDIIAPAIAVQSKPGQFVMATGNMGDKPIALTIIDKDERRSVIVVLVHVLGTSTQRLADLGIGDEIFQLVGPLGQPSLIANDGLVICVATGTGAAQILPICRGLKKRGNKVIGIMGARTKKELMLESQMRVVCDDIFIATEDGSYERKGLASGLLKELLLKYPVKRVYAIGSVAMMKAASQMTLAKNIPLRVTLNPYMINGLGLCGSCRVSIGGKILLACVDGPEFDGHLVDYDHLSQRMLAMEPGLCENQVPLKINPKSSILSRLVKRLLGSTRK